MSYILPKLDYSYDDFETYIDKKTMFIHHTKHHQSYIDNTNKVLKDLELSEVSIENLVVNLDKFEKDKKNFLRNNAGGHLNHTLFWKGLKLGSNLKGKLKNSIENNFSTIDNFKQQFEKVSMNHFGSGWVWLIKNSNNLHIISTSNQDNPLMIKNTKNNIFNFPIFGIDIWEHAYYLKYQNRKLDYIKSVWNLINWDEASVRFLNSD
ncbi:Fe-Mn family superoxide dismutase [Buchnera aphidicola (Neophyllaphis podocarpi)]|uniref:Fe-Mn family superoxide dismutase n=1 Tax=Buchnera aphidicola TaxID=9 RepID=UPI0031B851C9